MTVATPRRAAPLGRALRAELKWVLRRPRNLLALLLSALVPVLIGTVVTTTGGPADGDGPPGLAAVAGNGLVLPIVALTMAQALLLPLVVAMVAADALAGESANGTLRGLLLAPLARGRLVGIKAFGVLVGAILAVGVLVLSGIVTGLFIVGGGDMVTLSGTTVSLADGLSRVVLAGGWSMVQMAAVGAVALAVSACTDHPVVVMAATMGMLIVFGVIGSLPGLEWLQPWLLTNNWTSVTDVLRDPVMTDDLVTGLLRAACYLVIGLSLAVGRVATRDF